MDNENMTEIFPGTTEWSENRLLMEPWGYHLAAFVLFLIGFFGFSLNLFVIVLMCKDIQLWTPMNIILLNLVCSDFSVSILGNPLTLTAAISHKWIFGPVMCVAYGFFMALLGITSITTLTVLSYERYCLVSFPLSKRQLSNRGAMISVFLIWIYSFLLTSPPLFGWGAYVNEAANISCSVNWESQSFNATSYIVFLFIFGLVVPVFVISYSYINIIYTMKKNSARLGRANRAEGRVTLMVAVMIVAFLVAWAPYSVFALVEQFGPGDLISPGMSVLPALIAKSSIIYNPLIYVGLNTQFRASWRKHLVKESTIIETTVNQISRSDIPSVVCGPKLLVKDTTHCLKFKAKIFTRTQSKDKNDPTSTSTNNNKNSEILNNKNVLDNISSDGCDKRTKSIGKFIERMENSKKRINSDYEMKVLAEGKETILIRANSYHSDIC